MGLQIDLPDSLIAKIRDWGEDREEALDNPGLYTKFELDCLCDSVDEQADIIVDKITQLIQLAVDGGTLQ